MDLEPLLDQNVNIDGVARNASLGAIVMTDDRTPVYLDGIQSWNSPENGKRVRVNGVLRRRSLGPGTKSPSGELQHGIEGDSWVLEHASWSIT